MIDDDLDPDTETLDGHTLEQLSDYLDRGRTPADPSIDDSPGCQLALEGLARLRAVSRRSLESEAASERSRDDTWVGRILGGISLDAHAGRDIPLDAGPDEEVVLTEGAVRGIVRAAGDRSGALLVGRVRLGGDVTVPGEPITVSVETTVFWGERIVEVTGDLRRRIREALDRHTSLNIVGIDIEVHDVTVAPDAATEESAS